MSDTPGSADPQLRINNEWRSRGYLPHRDRIGLLQSITIRLADSLPQEKLRELEEELEDDENERGGGGAGAPRSQERGRCGAGAPRSQVLGGLRGTRLDTPGTLSYVMRHKTKSSATSGFSAVMRL